MPRVKTWNSIWANDPRRTKVREAIVALNCAGARWGLAQPHQYAQAEREFLHAWYDLLGVMSEFTDNYKPPEEYVPGPRAA